MSYAKHNGKDGTDVYALFRTSGLLNLFETDYDNLHSMSMEYLMQYFDEYLKDPESGLYGQSALFIFSPFVMEKGEIQSK